MLEQRDFLSDARLVSQWFEITRPFLADIITGVRKITDRFSRVQGLPPARVDGLPDLDSLIKQERLAFFEELKSDGLISDDEYTEFRSRILGDDPSENA